MVNAIGDIDNFIDDAVSNQSSLAEGLLDLEGVEVWFNMRFIWRFL